LTLLVPSVSNGIVRKLLRDAASAIDNSLALGVPFTSERRIAANGTGLEETIKDLMTLRTATIVMATFGAVFRVSEHRIRLLLIRVTVGKLRNLLSAFVLITIVGTHRVQVCTTSIL
jgi:hypothetical protein